MKFQRIVSLALLMLVTASPALAKGLSCGVSSSKGGVYFYLHSSTDKTVIYQENNSWGWESRWFEFKEKQTGKVYDIKRVGRTWKKNGPGVVTLDAQHGKDTHINFEDGTWYASPKLPEPADKEVLKGTLTPFFEITQEEAATGKTWAGKISGKPIEYWIQSSDIKALNSH
ncbi:MAG: hypothetical protein JST01_05160 [Cyanobacteria bacterium SZAS TMP-1]|nr:hypothetical protein [Cyanobacteria bacterium SZAS TMP-1]